MAGITYTIDFAAAIARLEEGTAKSVVAVKKMAAEMEASSNFARDALASIGIGLSGAAFIAIVKSAAEAADAAAKMGDRFGIATEQMIGMQHAANLASVSNEGLTTALRGIAKSGIEAAQGNEAARIAFERLHLVASDFIRLPMDQQLSVVIDRLGTMENAAVRNATAQALMGRNAGQMMGLVADGSEAFEKAAADTEAWGLALNRVDAAKIEMANDAFKRAEAATRGAATQIALHLSPTIVELMNQFSDAAAATHGFSDEISTLDAGLKSIASIVLGVAGTFSVATATLGTAFATLGGFLLGDFKGAVDVFKEGLDKMSSDAELWGGRINAIWATTGTSIDEQAKKIAERRQKFMQEGGDPGITPFDDYTARLAQQLGALIDHNRNELQVVQEQYDRRQALLDESVAKGLITDDFWQGQSMVLYAGYEEQREQLIFKEYETQRRKNELVTNMEMNTWRLGAEFLQTFAGKSKAAAIAVIAISKALAIAQTIAATAAATMRAFADLGPIAGIPAAAEIQTLGQIQIGLIAATGLGQAMNVGGGGASVGSPANPVNTISPFMPSAGASSPQAPTQITVIVNNNGTIVGQNGMQQFVEENIVPGLQDLIDNNDVVIIGRNSRQAADLASA